MKVIINNGTKQIEVNLKFVENKPLVVVDSNLLDKTTILSNDYINTLGIDTPTSLTYKLKSVKEDESDDIVNVGTLPHYYSKGSMDLIYIPLHKTLALIPNLNGSVNAESGLLDIEAISIGGKNTSDSKQPNLSLSHTENSVIDLNVDFSNIVLKTQVNSIFGCVKSSNANPTLQTDYLPATVGEIMLGEATPVLNITLTTTNVPAFKNENYDASVLYNTSIDRFKLKAIENMKKQPTYMVVLG